MKGIPGRPAGVRVVKNLARSSLRSRRATAQQASRGEPASSGSADPIDGGTRGDDPEGTAGLAYSRAVYAGLVDWYKVADAKGQLLLTLNGIFITVLSGVVLLAPTDLADRKAEIGPIAWILLTCTATATAASVICAIVCLYSRLSSSRLQALQERFAERAADGALTYRPAATFWFGTIAGLDRTSGLAMLRGADSRFELDAISEEVLLLAPNVLAKHRWVNRGWMAAAVSLLLLLASSVSVVADGGA